MKIWKNTSTLDGFDQGLTFTDSKEEASIALLGSKPIKINQFKNLKGIFRAGIGRDNVPEKEATSKGIEVVYPQKKVMNIIYEETAAFTCNLIFRMAYSKVGTISPWQKESRSKLSGKYLLIIGSGNIGARVSSLMSSFMKILVFDIKNNDISELKFMIRKADLITVHIPMDNDNIAFFDKEKLSWVKNHASLINTSRGAIFDEEALFQELKQRRLKAAFDVYWNEPYQGKLSELNQEIFYMTPHVASTCKEFLLGCRESLDNLINKIKKNIG